MVMYALAIDPLMKKYAHDTIQVWCADNASADGTASELFSWWEKLVEHGPQFGYCPKACKSSVVVKEGFEGKAPEVFEGTGFRVTQEGSMHLGIPFGICKLSKQLH